MFLLLTSDVRYQLPAKPTVGKVLILDPLVATGNTAVACVRMILDWGIKVENIRFLAVLGSEPGLTRLAETFPDLTIYTAAIDEHLDDKGYVLPGLGDTGDRLFDTL